MRAEMNSLNSCGATDECEQSKLEFLFKLAGRKLVKNIVRDKLSEKIPELPPIVPPGPPTPNPPPPPLRPSTCLGSPCGALIDGEIKLGRCVVGTGGAEAACSRYGFAPFPENSNPIGCSRYSETYCHCCDTSAPVPPPVPPPIPPPIPPPPPPPPGPTPPPVPPPVFPPRPPEGQCGIFGSACVTYIEDVGTVFGTCFAKKYGDEAQPEIATCAEVGGVPALVARGCGGGSECICCVDGASLCAGTPNGNCGGGYCSCILTYNGGYWSRSYVRSSSCSLALARSLARGELQQPHLPKPAVRIDLHRCAASARPNARSHSRFPVRQVPGLRSAAIYGRRVPGEHVQRLRRAARVRRRSELLPILLRMNIVPDEHCVSSQESYTPILLYSLRNARGADTATSPRRLVFDAKEPGPPTCRNRSHHARRRRRSPGPGSVHIAQT